MAQRDPCCWKWHSSSNQISTSSLAANRRSFFKTVLLLGIRVGNERTRFTSSKTQPFEQALALSHTEAYPEFLGRMMTKELTIPKVLGIPKLRRQATQVFANLLDICLTQSCWATRSRCILNTGKTALFKPLYPVLNRPRTVSEKLCDFMRTQPRAYKKNSVKPVVVPRLLGSQNLFLDGNPHNVGVLDFQLAHNHPLSVMSITERQCMRNYL